MKKKIKEIRDIFEIIFRTLITSYSFERERHQRKKRMFKIFLFFRIIKHFKHSDEDFVFSYLKKKQNP